MVLKQDLIVVTGANGFIGSCLVSQLNQIGFENLILVDNFTDNKNHKNLDGKIYSEKYDILEFITLINNSKFVPKFIFHLGAISSTLENNIELLNIYNLEYSKKLWNYCTLNSINFIYASSAATYGDGSMGYSDVHENIKFLKPLNLYGHSKNDFDNWVLNKKKTPPYWIGLKFFNVYGPNEYFKQNMSSVIYKAYQQIVEKGEVNLFKSYNDKFSDGEQLRDFVYVKDVVKICSWMIFNQIGNGIYNIGTGKCQSFKELVNIIFKILGKETKINFVDMDDKNSEKYQYLTEADITKLRSSGYDSEFFNLENGIKDYVINYLEKKLHM